MNPIIKNIVLFFTLILVQVLVLKSIDIGLANWWITPFFYIILIIELPVRTNGAIVLLLAALMGFLVDIFYNTLGFHMSAAVLTAFIRRYVINLTAPREGFEPNARPQIKSIGLYKYAVYSGLLFLIYHLWFFIIEVFSFDNFFLRILQAIVSGLTALGLAILFHYMFNRTKR